MRISLRIHLPNQKGYTYLDRSLYRISGSKRYLFRRRTVVFHKVPAPGGGRSAKPRINYTTLPRASMLVRCQQRADTRFDTVLIAC